MEEERRQFERFNLKLPAQMKPDTGRRDTSEALNFLTKDICAGGAYLEGPESLPEGTKVSLDLVLNLKQLKQIKNERALIHVKGRVIRYEEGTGLAISFDKNYRITPL